MFSRDVILKELERRIDAIELFVWHPNGTADIQALSASTTLTDLRDFILSLPAPEASELAKEARRHAAYAKLAIEYGGTTDLLTDIADALELAEAKAARLESALRNLFSVRSLDCTCDDSSCGACIGRAALEGVK